jgi:hypothetical protein
MTFKGDSSMTGDTEEDIICEDTTEEDRKLDKLLVYSLPQSENENELGSIVKALNRRLNELSSVNANYQRESNDEVDSNIKDRSSNRKQMNKLLHDSSSVSKESNSDGIKSLDDGIFDPVKLIFLTKPNTESAKRLEMKLEESHNAINIRDKNKISKSNRNKSNASQLKVVEHSRNEAKRLVRLKLEKDLQSNMESFMTRSITEASLQFTAPQDFNQEPKWPITINWPAPDVSLFILTYCIFQSLQ